VVWKNFIVQFLRLFSIRKFAIPVKAMRVSNGGKKILPKHQVVLSLNALPDVGNF
jgi:hypothetical protein